MILWLLYFLSQTVHFLSKAWFAVNTPPGTSKTYAVYFSRNGVPIIVRIFLATGFFVWWWNDPMLVSGIFDKVGSYFQEPLRSIIMGIEFPLNAGTAMVYGFASDSGLDKLISLVPMFRPVVLSMDEK